MMYYLYYLSLPPHVINTGFNVNIFPLSIEDFGPDMREYVLLLQGAVGFVLLIAGANIANLMMARAIGRRKELAIRLALGATRWSLMRQMFTESLLLSLSAGAAGSLLALWGIRAWTSRSPNQPGARGVGWLDRTRTHAVPPGT